MLENVLIVLHNATTLLFGALLCCGAAAAGCLLTPWILQATAVPSSIFEITGVYLRITFLGAPFTFFYNALAAGLKSVGDSKTPLKFLAFSAVLNAVLDFVKEKYRDFFEPIEQELIQNSELVTHRHLLEYIKRGDLEGYKHAIVEHFKLYTIYLERHKR